jgi:hypothetical protein
MQAHIQVSEQRKDDQHDPSREPINFALML